MWQTLERTRTILQIIVSVTTIAASLSLWFQIKVPGWVAAFLVGMGFGVGHFLGRRRDYPDSAALRPKPAIAIDRIALEYSDDPTNHGWRITHDEGLEKSDVQFSLKADPVVGRYTSIEARPGTRVDYDLAPVDFIADVFELEYRPESDAVFYVRLKVVGAVHKAEDHWLQYRIGHAEPMRRSHREWTISVQPSPKTERWLSLRCDLKKHFELTFGQEGLILDHISGFRIRGVMSVAAITLYASAQGHSPPANA